MTVTHLVDQRATKVGVPLGGGHGTGSPGMLELSAIGFEWCSVELGVGFDDCFQ